jgi:hypothetical protein
MLVFEDRLKKIIRESIKKVLLENTQNEIIAYHGTTADFDKFDLKFINTGEKTQEYGNGVYVSGVESTGKMYAVVVNLKQNKDSLKKSHDPNWDKYNKFLGVISMLHFTKDSQVARDIKIAFMKRIDKTVSPKIKQQFLDEYNKISGNVSDRSEMRIGRPVQTVKDFLELKLQYKRLITQNLDRPLLYKVEIPDDGYIDWNDTNQEFINKMFDLIVKATGCNLEKKKFKTFGKMFFYLTGGYETEAPSGYSFADKEIIRHLFMKLGYKGIMMPTGNNMGGGGDGFGMNYVIFNPDDVKILSKGKVV